MLIGRLAYGSAPDPARDDGKGMPPPTVSVLTTVFNGEHFVAEAVQSVLATTDVDLEVVVVDDGSTDGTAVQLAAIDDPRVTVLSREHEGRAAALNAAAARSSGRYLAVLDADDIALPGRLADPVAFLEAHPDVDLVGSGTWVFVDEAGHELGRRPGPAVDDAGIRRLLRRQYAPFPHSSITVRKGALDAVGGYDVDLTVGLDVDLYIRVGGQGRLAALPQPLVATRRHAEQYFARRKGEAHSMRRRLASRRVIGERAAATFGGSSGFVRVTGRELGSWAYWRARPLLGPKPVLSPAVRRRLDRLWARGARGD